MNCHWLDPLEDPRWDRFTRAHPRASVFHSHGWLEALRRTYGYRPVVLTASPPGRELDVGVLFCEVDSWLTGHRLVSLPFSDHCEPLAEDAEALLRLLSCLVPERKARRLSYIEIRPLSFAEPGPFHPSSEFWLHRIDLRRSPGELLHAAHPSCVRSKIRRALHEGVQVEVGRSEAMLREFYQLFSGTRRRHCLAPPPFRWFRNLMDCLGDSAAVRIAHRESRPIAAMLTLRHNDTLIYKNGCTDASSHRYGGMQLLFWTAIQEAQREGLREFDLGRSDCAAAGLVRFKERLGASRSRLTYWTYPARGAGRATAAIGRVQRVAQYLPCGLLEAFGNLAYRHAG